MPMVYQWKVPETPWDNTMTEGYQNVCTTKCQLEDGDACADR